jgi:hypothetical protein
MRLGSCRSDSSVSASVSSPIMAGPGESETMAADALVPVWRHDIQVLPAAPDRTLYCDEVVLRAGLLTPGVWLFAQLFHRWRQHRWRRLARTGFATLAGTMP